MSKTSPSMTPYEEAAALIAVAERWAGAPAGSVAGEGRHNTRADWRAVSARKAACWLVVRLLGMGYTRLPAAMGLTHTTIAGAFTDVECKRTQCDILRRELDALEQRGLAALAELREQAARVFGTTPVEPSSFREAA
jgi:hypothetical protein